MGVVAIIPARGGSKGIKDKNITNLGGVPLIAHVITTLLNSKKVDHIAVTSNSEKILEIARKIEKSVICIKRPYDISGDTCISETALLHAINAIERQGISFDRVLFVQATSPLTESKDIDYLLQKLNGHDSAAFYVEDYGHFFELDEMKGPRLPRQNRVPRKREAGNAWAFYKEGFKQSKSRLFGNVALAKLDQPKELEIDEAADLDIVEILLRWRGT